MDTYNVELVCIVPGDPDLSAVIRGIVAVDKTEAGMCALRLIDGPEYWKVLDVQRSARPPRSLTMCTTDEAIARQVAHETEAERLRAMLLRALDVLTDARHYIYGTRVHCASDRVLTEGLELLKETR